MAVTPPPKKNTGPQPPVLAPETEKKISAFIQGGGSSSAPAGEPEEDDQALKGMNIKLLPAEIKAIHQLRAQRPGARGRKRLAISLHDWIIEAVQEKIEREQKKYKIAPE